jgi:hypothetical protein
VCPSCVIRFATTGWARPGPDRSATPPEPGIPGPRLCDPVRHACLGGGARGRGCAVAVRAPGRRATRWRSRRADLAAGTCAGRAAAGSCHVRRRGTVAAGGPGGPRAARRAACRPGPVVGVGEQQRSPVDRRRGLVGRTARRAGAGGAGGVAGGPRVRRRHRRGAGHLGTAAAVGGRHRRAVGRVAGEQATCRGAAGEPAGAAGSVRRLRGRARGPVPRRVGRRRVRGLARVRRSRRGPGGAGAGHRVRAVAAPPRRRRRDHHRAGRHCPGPDGRAAAAAGLRAAAAGPDQPLPLRLCRHAPDGHRPAGHECAVLAPSQGVRGTGAPGQGRGTRAGGRAGSAAGRRSRSAPGEAVRDRADAPRRGQHGGGHGRGAEGRREGTRGPLDTVSRSPGRRAPHGQEPPWRGPSANAAAHPRGAGAGARGEPAPARRDLRVHRAVRRRRDHAVGHLRHAAHRRRGRLHPGDGRPATPVLVGVRLPVVRRRGVPRRGAGRRDHR